MIQTTGFVRKWILTPAAHNRLAGKIKHKPLLCVLTVSVWAITLLFPTLCYLAVEYIHFTAVAPGRFVAFLQNRGEVALGMITLFHLFWWVLLFLSKKASVASSILAGVVLACSVTNYFKYSLTGDFFYPWDFVQAGNLGELSGFLSHGIPLRFLAVMALTLISALLPLLINASLPLRFYVRIPLALLLLFCMFHTVSSPKKVEAYCNRNGMDASQAAVQQSNYMDNGFVGGFTLNVLSLQVTPPEDYSEAAVDALLDSYKPEAASEQFTRPDVIVILSESFWDPKRLPGSTFTTLDGNEVNPIMHFDEIASRPGTISGVMAVSALGGGTVRPEFEVLTGLSSDYLPSGSIPYQYLTGGIDAYPAMFRSLGYTTYSVHPYQPAFYSRQSRYPFIGIDRMHFEEDIYNYAKSTGWNWQFRGKYIADISFVEYIEMLLDANTQTPSFLVGISMEAHQPYEAKYNEKDLAVFAHNDLLSEESLNSFRNYTMAMYDADNALAELVDYIDRRDQDTVLVYFGDHLPTLGANYAAYLESGLIDSTSRNSQAERYATQCTPFLIYANFEFSESRLVHEGTDNKISSYNLLNAACELMGAPRTEYMQWLADFGMTCPLYNNRLKEPLTEKLQSYLDAHRLITYDRVVGKNYSKGR